MAYPHKDRISEALRTDEIGLTYGVWGEVRLRAAYRHVYARRGEALHLAGAEGLVVPATHGRTVPAERLLHELGPADAEAFHGLLLAVVLNNHRHVPHGTSLFLECGPVGDTPAATIAALAGDAGADPGRIVCLARGGLEAEGDEAAALITDLHARGFSVAVDQRSAGQMLFDPMHAAAPDFVRIDGAWLAGAEYEPRIAALLGRFVVAMRQLGIRSLVTGLATQAQLAGALAAGADLFQGPVLSGLVLAGADFEEEPLQVEDLLGRKSGLLAR